MKGVAGRVKKSVGSEQVLAMTMALPAQAVVLRMPTVDAPRTSAAKLKDQYTITTTSATSVAFNSGDLLFALYGQPGRQALVWTTLRIGIYKLRFPEAAGTGTTQSWSWLPQVSSGSVGLSNPMPIASMQLSAGGPTHGMQLPVGLGGDRDYMFMNNGDTLTVSDSFGTSTLVGTVNFSVFKWVNANTPPVHTTTTVLTLVNGRLPLGGIVCQAGTAGYYAVEVEGTQITSGSNTTPVSSVLTLNCVNSAGWMLIHMGDLDSSGNGDPSLAEDTRCVATSMLITNTSALLSRQGTVLASRIRGIDAVDLTPSLLAKSAEKYTGDAAKGCYTFMEFSTERERFRSHVVAETSLCYCLDVDDYYHFVQITCPGVVTTPNTYTVSFDNVLEFKTDSARYSKNVATLSHVDLIIARRIINSNPEWFFENPTHMSALYNWISTKVGNTVRGARKYAGPISNAASALDPSHASVYQLLGRLLQE